MEMNERFLTLLTPEGEFLRAHNYHNHYQLGQEIEFFPVDMDETKKSFLLPFLHSFKGKAIISIALILTLTFASLLPLIESNDVYAYMSIDVNPSIELGINDQFEVIEFVAYNNEGKNILEQIKDWKKKNIHVLTDEILHEMKMQGYIKPNREIVIATVYKEKQQGKSKRWEEEMSEIKDVVNRENLELKVVEGSKEDRKQAIEEGLTTGQYKIKQFNMKPAATQQSEKSPLKDDSKKLEKPNEKKDITQNQSKIQPKQQVEQKRNVQSPKKQHENDKYRGNNNRKTPDLNSRTHNPPGHEKKMEKSQNQPIRENEKGFKDKPYPPGQNNKQKKKHDYRDDRGDRKYQSNYKDKKHHHKSNKDD